MKILDTIRAALRSPEASSSELRAALGAIDLPALETAVRQAERRRAGLLLDGTENDLDAADATLKVATRERDRAVAAQAELGRRLVDAEAADAAGALDAERSAVEREAKKVENWLREKWTVYQAAMVDGLERLHDAEIAVAEVNDRLVAAGRADLIRSVEVRVFPVPDELHAPAYSIRNQTVFRAIDGVLGWNVGFAAWEVKPPTDANGKPVTARTDPAASIA